MNKLLRLFLIIEMLMASGDVAYSAIPENIWQLPLEQQLDVLAVDLSEKTGEDRAVGIEWIERSLEDDPKTDILAGLYKVLANYNSDTTKAYAVLALIDRYPDVSSVDPLMAAWKKNAALEEDIAYKISRIYDVTKNEAAYSAMITLYKQGLESKFLFKDLVEYAKADKVQSLLTFYRDPAFEGKREILRKLAEISTPSIVVPLAIEALQDQSIAIRQTASTVLGDLGDKSAIPALKQVQKLEKDIFLKLNMSEQLVRLGEFLYIDEILKVVETSRWSDLTDVRNATFDRLKSLTGQDFGDNIVSWRRWFEQEKIKRGLK